MKRAALSVFCLLLLAAPAGAAEELAASPGRIVADAYGGRVAWAQFDASSGLWKLVEHRGGKVRRLRAGAFQGPVTVDLGPGPDGGVVAVYSRDGRLFLYDFAKRKERHLIEFGTGSLPSIWRGQMLFTRREAGVSSLWLGKLGTGRLAKLPGGPVAGPSGPVATELRGSRVVYVWSSLGRGGFTEVELYEVRRGRAVRRDRTGSGSGSTSTFVTPEIVGSRVYYGRATYGRPGQQLRRVSLRNGRVHAVRAPFGPLVSAQWTRGGRFLLSRVDPKERKVGAAECGMRDEKPLSQSICRLVSGDPITGWAPIRSRVAH